LDKMIQEVEHFVDSEKTYNEVPHILDICLPMLCSYLPFWWAQGPDNNLNTAQE
jgi:ryanodine receptor 2